MGESLSSDPATLPERDRDGASSMKNGSVPFTIKDEPVENQRRMRVVIIGAGFSGIYTTIRITQRLRNIDLQVYEQNEEVSGVWWQNRYPGLACDIPSYSYQFSFAPNPFWSALYAPGPEIRRYMQEVAERFGAMRFIKTSHAVKEGVWDEENKKWRLKVLDTKSGKLFDDTADILISCRGGFNRVMWPDIPGLHSFKNKLIHSGQWDEGYDLRHKRVGVIGNGSSAIQIVPAIQPLEGIEVFNFGRNPTWITNSFGDSSMEKLGMDPKVTKFSRRHQEDLARHPEKYYKIRKTLEEEAAKIFPITIKGTPQQLGAREVFLKAMQERLKGRPDLYEAIIPTFSPGCRRLTPGPGYLEALQKDNTTYIKTHIQEITEKGIKLVSGEEIDLDVIVCATGYDVQAPPLFTLEGRHGKMLAEKWKPYPVSYLGVAVDEFPNLLIVGGPNAGLGSGSLVSVFEAQGDYAVKMIRKLQKEDYALFEIQQRRVEDFGALIEEYFKRTVYMDNCTSWYRVGKNSQVFALWPGSSAQCLEVLRAPRWEDYNYESADPTGNSLRWLGNGWSITLTEGDPSWHLDKDVVDVPQEGKPEESEFYRRRPYSY